MLEFQENYENTEQLYGVCQELAGVAQELGIETPFTLGLSQETDAEGLQTVRQLLEQAIEAADQEALAAMGRCCMGYKWRREGAGYRCEGGTHTIGQQELRNFQQTQQTRK